MVTCVCLFAQDLLGAIARSATATFRIQVNMPYLQKTAGSRLAVRELSSSLNLSRHFNDTPYA
jgi:hypothetical protein